MKNEDEQKTCSKCNDTGFILREEEGSQPIAKECICRKMDATSTLWRQSGISIDNLDKSFKDFISWNETIKILKDTTTGYCIRFKSIKRKKQNSLLLSGQSGCGKTHLTLALANMLLTELKVQVIYLPYREIITNIKQNITNEEYYKSKIERYKNAEVLFIDDLFKGKITESDINIIFEILDYRYFNKKPMIINTEHTINELLRIDEAIGSRIYEMCKNYLVEIKGMENNYRLK